MRRIAARFGHPLLSKELIEQAARKRTYVIRVVYALLLFASALVLFFDTLSIGTALDVLCTTPLTGREIVLQKYRAVSRLMWVLLAPFFTIFYFHCATRWRMGTYAPSLRREFDLPLYVVCSLLTVATYLPLVAWLSIAAGLRLRTQARAIIAATGGLLVWSVAPVLLVTMPLAIFLDRTWARGDYHHLLACTAMLSPAAIIPFNEFDDLHELGTPWLALVANFAFYAGLLLATRYVCLRNADRWLGRTVGKGERGPQVPSS